MRSRRASGQAARSKAGTSPCSSRNPPIARASRSRWGSQGLAAPPPPCPSRTSSSASGRPSPTPPGCWIATWTASSRGSAAARPRTHDDILQLAASSEKPVINGLTDRSHPCQVLADLLTLEEVRGELPKQHVVYVGDGNNVTTSLIEASALTGFALTIVSPSAYQPQARVLERARSISSTPLRVTLSSDLTKLDGATAIYTDVWASMGQESERDGRRKAFAEYQVNQAVMDAAPGAIFMHCLPAHRGEEVTDEVIDGPRSVVFDQAGNRLYAQMALMASLFGTEG